MTLIQFLPTQITVVTEWRVISDQNSIGQNKDLERSEQGDIELIYEVQKSLDLFSLSLARPASDHDFRLDDVTKQREQLQTLELNLKARLIATLQLMEMQYLFDSPIRCNTSLILQLQRSSTRKEFFNRRQTVEVEMEVEMQFLITNVKVGLPITASNGSGFVTLTTIVTDEISIFVGWGLFRDHLARVIYVVKRKAAAAILIQKYSWMAAEECLCTSIHLYFTLASQIPWFHYSPKIPTHKGTKSCHYYTGDMLGGYLDDMEADWSKPIVSMSLGYKAIFLLGEKSRNDEPLAMFLRSGDIVQMSGEARKRFHDVDSNGLNEHLNPKESNLLFLVGSSPLLVLVVLPKLCCLNLFIYVKHLCM